ncbi:MAG: hypothetical protein ACRYF5_07745 [Janthinobacterium lividum]
MHFHRFTACATLQNCWRGIMPASGKKCLFRQYSWNYLAATATYLNEHW